MSLEQELKTEHVSHLDLSGFSRATSETAVRDVLNLMQSEKNNVCLITEEDELVGILTDRDVLRKIAAHPETWDQPVSSVMTPNPVTIAPTTSAAAALWLMDEKKFRNLPIVDENGAILGDMTHRSVITYLAARYPVEVLNRPPKPHQYPQKPEGGD